MTKEIKTKGYVVTKKPGVPAEVVPVTSLSLAFMQEAVDGYIELIRFQDFDIWVNEEGILREMPANLRIEGRGVLVGPVLACARGRDENGDEESVPFSTEEEAVFHAATLNKWGLPR